MGKDIWILILLVKDLIEDKVDGLFNGVDDYLIKFFFFDEFYVWLFCLM